MIRPASDHHCDEQPFSAMLSHLHFFHFDQRTSSWHCPYRPHARTACLLMHASHNHRTPKKLPVTDCPLPITVQLLSDPVCSSPQHARGNRCPAGPAFRQMPAERSRQSRWPEKVRAGRVVQPSRWPGCRHCWPRPLPAQRPPPLCGLSSPSRRPCASSLSAAGAASCRRRFPRGGLRLGGGSPRLRCCSRPLERQVWVRCAPVHVQAIGRLVRQAPVPNSVALSAHLVQP